MKYQTEYQRNYQKRTPRAFHELPVEERKLSEAPIRRSASSPSRRRGRSVPASPDRNNGDFALIGPNEKFSQSQLYRMKEPVKDHPRVAKSQEFALLGKNSKFENNVVYPLRKPVQSDSPRVVVRRRNSKNHSCGIQTNLKRTKGASFDSRHKGDEASQRKRNTPLSEYKQQYDWKRPATSEGAKREQQPNSRVAASAIERPEKTSVGVNTPARVKIDVNKVSKPTRRTVTHSTKPFRPKRDDTTEYRTRYKPLVVEPKQPRPQKALEAEQIDERRREQQVPKAEHSRSDDEVAGGTVDLGQEFREKYPHGKLRRWKSEYQSTYKPFWRFDYKDGKWYKDSSVDEKGFNPNLFWYQELMSTRKRADEFRSKAETDHFNPDHTLQLKAGYGASNYQAWDVHDDEDEDSDSVISIDRDLERERIEGQRRREKDAQRKEDERIRYEKPKQHHEKSTKHQTDQVVQTDHQVDRVVYIDEPLPKQPSIATRAFVRNLGSSSVQQHMSWDSESLYSQRSNSDIDYDRHHNRTDNSKHQTNIIRRTSPKKHKSRGTGTHSPLPNDRPQRTIVSPHVHDRATHQNGSNTNGYRPATSSHDTCNATGGSSYDSHLYDRRPYTSANEYCSYPGSRFKDEVTDYYYGGLDDKQQQHHPYAPTPKPSYQNYAQLPDERYDRTYNPQNKEDDGLSVQSVRSLSSSCSLASQTLERANKNLNKYWNDRSPASPSSPKKSFNAKR
ncbi:unnamed protein product [Adineta ricciae]|uniref:Nuclear protein MDM1 n=1 Tax=Adineta ricciae TaxID=249248 RepID=A0A814UI22_ADIRI|nr:unnamed protein product [Adineta ricciae]CAF1179575.1 unnamed protein product [Adineta ricciae]